MDQISVTEPVGTSTFKVGGKAHGHKPATALFDRLMATTVSTVTNAPASIKITPDAKPAEGAIDPAVLSLIAPDLADEIAIDISIDAVIDAPSAPETDLGPTVLEGPEILIETSDAPVDEMIVAVVPTALLSEAVVVSDDPTAELIENSAPIESDVEAPVVSAEPVQVTLAPAAVQKAPELIATAPADQGTEPVSHEVDSATIEEPKAVAPKVLATTPQVAPNPEAKLEFSKDTAGPSKDRVTDAPVEANEPVVVAAPVNATVVQNTAPVPQAAVTKVVTAQNGPTKTNTTERVSKTIAQPTPARITGTEVKADFAEPRESAATERSDPRAMPQPVSQTMTRTTTSSLIDMPDHVITETTAQIPQTVAAPIEQPLPADAQISTDAMNETASELPSVDTTQDNWVETLSTQIEMTFTETGGEAEIALTPENLGAIRIRMEMRDGAALVMIVTETADAARLFNQNEGRLSEMLSKSGVTLTGQDAGTDPRRDQNAQRGQGQTFANGRTETNTNETNGSTTKTVTVGTRLVNLIA